MSNKKKYLLIALVLIIATFFRFYHLTTTPPGLYPDEAMNGNNATEVIATNNFKVFYPENNGREGLFIGIQTVFLKLFAVHEPWVLRLPSAIAGTLTVLGLYLLVAELFGVEVGLLAALLLAANFWHINFSRIGFRAIMAPLLITWALWLIVRAFKAASSRTGIAYAALAGIVYSLGFYTYIAYRVTPLLFLLFIPFYRKRPEFWKRVFVFITLTFIVAAPIGWYFLKNPADFFGRTSEISTGASSHPLSDLALNIVKTAAMFNFVGDGNWRHNISGAPELFPPVGILFLVGIVLGIHSLWRALRRKTLLDDSKNDLPVLPVSLTFLWFLLAMLPTVISNEGLPHALRSILMLPPAIILAAVGGIALYRMIPRSLKILGLVFIVIVLVGGYTQYFVVWAKNPEVQGAFSANYVDIGREINALPASVPKYVIVETGGVLVRGIPMPTQTTMFITDTYLPEKQAMKNVYYLPPNQESQIPSGTPSNTIFYIR